VSELFTCIAQGWRTTSHFTVVVNFDILLASPSGVETFKSWTRVHNYLSNVTRNWKFSKHCTKKLRPCGPGLRGVNIQKILAGGLDDVGLHKILRSGSMIGSRNGVEKNWLSRKREERDIVRMLQMESHWPIK